LTYLKRYQISALLQINSDEDDDGATANETVVTYKLPDSKLPELKAFLANGGSLDQVKQKYFLTPSQLKQLTEI